MVNQEKIRELAIISLFYDDDLIDMFVLKGGNALNLVYGLNNRSSSDVDVSMEDDFTPEELAELVDKLQSSFDAVFSEENLKVFDLRFYATPGTVPEEYAGFWGGYTVEFKCIDAANFNAEDIDNTRKRAIVVGERQLKTFKIDISKYEYCAPKEQAELGGFTIYVYTPIMVVIEKLRAICQQMEEYRLIVRTNRRPRAKDFFDIYTIVEGWKTPIDLYEPENVEMLKEVFNIKKVPLEFLGSIVNEREFHRDSFNNVKDTVSGLRIETYDYYFDYVLKLVEPLSYLWDGSADDQIAAITE